MRATNDHPSRDQLQILLHEDESSQTYRRMSAHVEGCESCQHQLEELTLSASHGVDWRDLGHHLLNEGRAVEERRTGPARQSAALPDTMHDDLSIGSLQDYLQPALHPELLGRIGRYEVERVIGRGGMGIVLKAHDSELNRPVAIKVLARHLSYSGPARQRFAREAKAAAAVVHDNVVAIHNVETEHETPFLVMQYVPGESLQSRVDRTGPLELTTILRIASQAAGGLAAAHEQGVVHRDVKPANLLLKQGVDRALLTDFGLARTVDDASLTHTGILAGTPHYMSPEQARGETTDARTDLFSLGAVIYFMATGHPPFRAEKAMGVLHQICQDRHVPLWESNPEVPPALCAIVDRLLEKRPGKRYASAREVQRDLQRVLSNRQLVHPRAWRTLRWAQLAARSWKAGAFAMLLIGMSWLALANPSEAPHPGKTLGSTTQRFPENQSPAAASPQFRNDTEDRSLDLEIWNLASSQEQASFERALQDLEQKLSAMEQSAEGHFIPATHSRWDEFLQEFGHRWMRLEQSRGSDTSLNVE